MTSGEPGIVGLALRWGERTALARGAERHTYRELLHGSGIRAAALLAVAADSRDLSGERVVYLVEAGFGHVAWQWAAWRAGAIAVPLSASQAPAEWDHIIDDVRPAVVVADLGAMAVLAPMAERCGAKCLPSTAPNTGPSPLPAVGDDRPALILYTSGTTSRPKGVVSTHANLAAQVRTLVAAWGWTSNDRILHVLPLNHVHGIVNVLGCALGAGACCEFLAPFDAGGAWERLAVGDLTLFMAVPTIYSKLLSAFDAADRVTRSRWSEGARRMRLMVSGSAALPVSVLERWRAATGHTLLERYGMTEIGMALSNPLHGPRRPGFVGVPLPGVDVRLVDDAGRPVPDGAPGEIEVQGPAVFREYWRRPDATRDAFRDGWFRTGDVAVVEDGSYRILGRSSVDIIKTGGYKVSALEIEEVLREHPAVAEVAVVGIPDEEWGERVAAAVVWRPGGEGPALEEIRAFAAARLARYKLPTRLASVDALPRNAMGKVVKASVRELF
jgi:malonyl-CoA/methylmalonyl-CoA synthetase